MNAYFQNGKLEIGCNYWASHAGTEMWKNWRPEIIDQDFSQLEKHGLTLIRTVRSTQWVQKTGTDDIPAALRFLT